MTWGNSPSCFLTIALLVILWESSAAETSCGNDADCNAQLGRDEMCVDGICRCPPGHTNIPQLNECREETSLGIGSGRIPDSGAYYFLPITDPEKLQRLPLKDLSFAGSGWALPLNSGEYARLRVDLGFTAYITSLLLDDDGQTETYAGLKLFLDDKLYDKDGAIIAGGPPYANYRYKLSTPVKARSIAINAIATSTTFTLHLKMDVLGTMMSDVSTSGSKIKYTNCKSPLLVKYQKYFDGSYITGRLHSDTPWAISSATTNPFINIDLGEDKTIVAVATQGGIETGVEGWVTSYYLKYNKDGETTVNTETITGNTDTHSVVMYNFPTPFVARYVSMYPQGHSGATNSKIMLRWEIYTDLCEEDNPFEYVKTGAVNCLGDVESISTATVDDCAAVASAVGSNIFDHSGFTCKHALCILKDTQFTSGSALVYARLESCTPGFDAIGSGCYFATDATASSVVQGHHSYSQGKDACRVANGELAIIESQAELDILVNMIHTQSSKHLIGLTYDGTNLVWDNGETAEAWVTDSIVGASTGPHYVVDLSNGEITSVDATSDTNPILCESVSAIQGMDVSIDLVSSGTTSDLDIVFKSGNLGDIFINYGDGKIEVIRLHSFVPGTTVQHDFGSIGTGNYNVAVHAYNKRSSETRYTMAIFGDPLTAAQVSVVGPVVLSAPSEFTVSATTGTGINGLINFGDGNMKQIFAQTTTDLTTISHTYESIGHYDVHAFLSTSYTTKHFEIVAVVETAITAITSVVSDLCELNETSTVTIGLAAGTNVECRVDYGDGFGYLAISKTTPMSENFTYVYPVSGDHLQTTTCKNAVSSPQPISTTIVVNYPILSSGFETTPAFDVGAVGHVIGNDIVISITVHQGTRIRYTCLLNGSPINEYLNEDQQQPEEYAADTPGESVATLTIPTADLSPGEYIVDINLDNDVSSENISGEFTLDTEISGLLLAVASEYVPYGTDIVVTADVTEGSRVSGTIVWGDSTADTVISDLNSATGPMSLFDVSHSYVQQGNGLSDYHNVEVTISNQHGSETATIFVGVESRVPDGTVMVISNITDIGNAVFNLDQTGCDIASNAIVQWNFDDGSAPLIIPVEPSFLQTNIQHYYSDWGYYDVSAEISNNVSTKTLSRTLMVGVLIDNFAISVLTPDVKTLVEDVELVINVDAGSDITYVINWGDGASGTSSRATNTWHLGDTQTITHTYSTPGDRTITVTANNHFGPELTETVEVNIENEILDLIIQNDSPVSHDSTGTLGTVIFTIEVDPASPHPPPSDTTCVFDHDDGLGTQTFEFTTGETIQGPHSYTYPSTMRLDTSVTTVTCSNLVSSFYLTTVVILQEPITQLACEAAEYYLATTDYAAISTSLESGSHLNFAFSYGDGIIDDTLYKLEIPRTVVGITPVVWTHYYAVGNYTPTVTVSNDISSMTQTCSMIVVQYVVPALTWEVTDPVIYPPGIMTYIIGLAW
ncbi:unnamed protein product, partial [Owenia fusiformis]